MSPISQLPTPPSNAPPARESPLIRVGNKSGDSHSEDSELEQKIVSLTQKTLPPTPYLLSLPEDCCLTVAKYHPDQVNNLTDCTPFTRAEAEIQYSSFLSFDKYNPLVRARGNWEEELNGTTTSGVNTPNRNLKKISLSDYRNKQNQLGAGTQGLNTPAAATTPAGALSEVSTQSQGEDRAGQRKRNHSTMEASTGSSVKLQDRSQAEKDHRPNLNAIDAKLSRPSHADPAAETSKAVLPLLPPLLSPTLPPLIERKLARLTDNRQLDAPTHPNHSSSQSHSDSPPPNKKPRTDSKPSKAPSRLHHSSSQSHSDSPPPTKKPRADSKPPKAAPAVQKARPTKSSFFNAFGRPSPSASPLVANKASKPTRLIVKLKLDRVKSKLAEKILKSIPHDSSISRKRPPTDNHLSANGPPAKKPKNSGSNLPQTPSEARALTPASGPRSGQKTLHSSPHDPLSVGVNKSSGQRADTPQGSRADGVSPAANLSNGVTPKEWARESQRLKDLGRKIKHDAEKILQTKVRPQPVVDEASKKKGSATYVESILCYMMAFSAMDSAHGRASRSRVNDWQSIFGLCHAVSRQCYDSTLTGLCHQMIAVCHEVLQRHHLSDGYKITDSTEPTSEMLQSFVAIYQNESKTRFNWHEASRHFPMGTLVDEFPSVWKGKLKALPKQDIATPGSYNHGYFLPLNCNSSVTEAVAYAEKVLKAWTQKQNIDWQSQLKL